VISAVEVAAAPTEAAERAKRDTVCEARLEWKKAEIWRRWLARCPTENEAPLTTLLGQKILRAPLLRRREELTPAWPTGGELVGAGGPPEPVSPDLRRPRTR
jgi:hypothetical protein